jgi:acetyl-CoA C-acetyltransferase
VLSAGLGQAPAQQAAIYGGLKNSTDCLTVNKVCSSGLKAVMLAYDGLRLGNSEVTIAGGMENMTLAPHLLENARSGYRMGSQTISDSMVKDGLWDPYNDFHMGKAGELCSREYKVSREEQDAFAVESYKRAQKALANGAFKEQIVPVEVAAGKTALQIIEDEEPGKAKFDKIPGLKPAFEKDGVITAANASKVNDGAAALLVTTEQHAARLNLKPLARIVAHATHSHQPEWFTTAPVGAVKKLLAKANLTADKIDLWEINEAFSVVPLVAMKELGLKHDRVNIHGGAVALGHPLGASGARILTTLIHALQETKGRYGIATLCNGGGEGTAVLVERL